MAELKIAVPGYVFLPELTTVQVPIAMGASGAGASANNILTLTFTAAHGLTFTPAAGTLPNYFVQLAGVTGMTGTGNLNGPIFRILSIPSTTTINIYSTVTGGVFTAATVTPIFIPTFNAQVTSQFAGGPQQPIGTPNPPAQVASSFVNMTLGANCVALYNPDNTSLIYDSTTGNTPATPPVFRTLFPASSSNQLWLDGTGGMVIAASGGAGTSRFSVVS